MSLNSSKFTRKNIENVLYNGKNLSAYPTQTEPYFIIKVGPPGAGKSSAVSNNEILKLGINPAEAVEINIDKINAAFKSFRNQTRKVRQNYNSKPFNLPFFSTLSGIHNAHQSLKNANNIFIKHDISSVVSQCIKNHKHIILETIRPINNTFKQFGQMLKKQNYKIIVFFYKTPLEILPERILKRGENLYIKNDYYRIFPLNTLPKVISELDKNLKEFIIPLAESGNIHKIVYIY